MILDNLDEIYQEVLEELSYRVGIVNLKDSYHFAIFNEILSESKLAPYSDVLIQSLCEADGSGKIWVKNKDSNNVYQIQKGHFDNSVHITASSSEVEKAKAKETEPKQKEKQQPTTQSLDGLLSGVENTSNSTKAKEQLKAKVKKLVNVFNELSNDPKNPHAKSHKIVGDLMEKMFSGKVLSPNEKNILHQFIRIAQPTDTNPNTTKFYIAKEPNNFKSSGSNKRDKVDFGSTPLNASFRQFTEKAGLSQMIASTFGTKLTTANQTFVDESGKTKLLKREDGKSIAWVRGGKGGKMQSIHIGDIEIKYLDENEPNITKEERKIRGRNNRNMDDYSYAILSGDLNFIDMDNGVSPDTTENRVTVIKGALNGMASRLRNLAQKEGVANDRITNLIDSMDTFAQRNPNDKPEQWFKDLNALMSSVANDEGEPSLKECWANYAEVYSAIVEMHDGGKGTQNGKCALLPESTTLKTVDVITIGNTGIGDRKIVTLDGRSVKKGVGAASGLAPKTEKSTYKNDRDGSKKKTIIEIASTYNDIYSVPLDESMDKQITLQSKYRNNLVNKSKALGISDDFISSLENDIKDEKTSAGNSISVATKKIEEQRKRDGLKSDSDTMQKIRLRLENYYRYMQLAHAVYNVNVDVQDFSNDSILSQSGDRGGSELVKNKDIKIDSSDGVNVLAYIRPEFNSGTWSNDGKSGNPGAGRFHNKPKQ